MIDKWCPWCGEAQPARVTRTDADCCEWECSACRRRWTIKDGCSAPFMFWPPDVSRAFDNDLEPLFS